MQYWDVFVWSHCWVWEHLSLLHWWQWVSSLSLPRQSWPEPPAPSPGWHHLANTPGGTRGAHKRSSHPITYYIKSITKRWSHPITYHIKSFTKLHFSISVTLLHWELFSQKDPEKRRRNSYIPTGLWCLSCLRFKTFFVLFFFCLPRGIRLRIGADLWSPLWHCLERGLHKLDYIDPLHCHNCVKSRISYNILILLHCCSLMSTHEKTAHLGADVAHIYRVVISTALSVFVGVVRIFPRLCDSKERKQARKEGRSITLKRNRWRPGQTHWLWPLCPFSFCKTFCCFVC